MTRTVGYSIYWDEWCKKVVASGIRKSKSEIVEEGLKRIQLRLDDDVSSIENAKELVREEKENQEAEENED